MNRKNQTDKERDAALLIGQALMEIDKIYMVDFVPYSEDAIKRDNKRYFDSRKITMKDVKPIAKRSAELLRQAWEILDPRQD